MSWVIAYFLTVAFCLLVAECVYRIRRSEPYEGEDQADD